MRWERDEHGFIEVIERMMVRWGYSPTDGKVYAILLLNDAPMTISELADRTGLSRSSISVSLSRLVREYMVNCRRSGKTKYFTPVPAFLEMFLRQPKDILDREVRPLKGLTERLLPRAEGERRRRLEAVLEDLKSLECVLEKVIKIEEEETDCIKKRGEK